MAICQARTGVLASVEARGALDVGGGEEGGLSRVGEGSGSPDGDFRRGRGWRGGGCSEVAEAYLFISPLALPPQR